MAYSAYTAGVLSQQLWITLNNPNAPVHAKYVQGVALIASVLPLVPTLSWRLHNMLQQFCFPAGTEVAVVEGTKPIEEIEPGDLVWAQSDHTGEVALKRVGRVFVNVASVLVVLHVGMATVEATPDHPVWVAQKGWKAAAQVQVGDELWSRAGESIIVKAIEIRHGQFTVHNFEVEDWHTYFVGKIQALVHNECVQIFGALVRGFRMRAR
jgi:hypothetical protein